MSERYITAIDLGSSKICTIIALSHDNGKLEIKGVGIAESQGIENGIIRDIKRTSEAIRNSLNIAEKQAHRQCENVFVAISGQHITSKAATGKISIAVGNQPCEVESSHIKAVINDANNSIKTRSGSSGLEVIHCIPQVFDVDSQKGISDPTGLCGFSMEVHALLLMAESSHIRNIHRAFQYANVQSITIVVGAIATAEAVVTDDEYRLGCIMIDIGGGTSDIVVYKNNCIHNYLCVPFGGCIITSDLEMGLRTPPKSAEHLKIEFGNATPNAVNPEQTIDVEGIGGRASQMKTLLLIAQITEIRLHEILDNCYKEVLVEYTNMENLTAGLILTGGTALMQNIEKLAENEEVFNMPTRVAYPNTRKCSGATSRLDNPAYACCIGLLYYIANNEKPTETTNITIKNITNNANAFFKTLINKIKEL